MNIAIKRIADGHISLWVTLNVNVSLIVYLTPFRRNIRCSN